MPKKQKLDFMFPKLHPQHSPTSGAFYSSGRKDKVLVCSGKVSETLTAGLLHGCLFPHLSLVRKVKDIFLHQPQYLSKHVVDEMAEITATSWGVLPVPPTWSGFTCNECYFPIHWSRLTNIYLVQFTSVGEQLSLSLKMTMINSSRTGDFFKWKNTSILKHYGSS